MERRSFIKNTGLAGILAAGYRPRLRAGARRSSGAGVELPEVPRHDLRRGRDRGQASSATSPTASSRSRSSPPARSCRACRSPTPCRTARSNAATPRRYYYFGKDPTFAFGTAIPFGLNAAPVRTPGGIFGGGERAAATSSCKDYNITRIPCGNTGAQMGGWFRKEIKTVADLKGLKLRIGGFAGQVLAKLGVVPQQIAGGDIYPALEKGTIDAAEWVGPYDDEKLGFNKVAKFYYYPGWWEGGPALHVFVNTKKWNELPRATRRRCDAGCAEGNTWMLAKYDAQNPPALRRLVAGGTQLRPFPKAVMEACYKAAHGALRRDVGEERRTSRRSTTTGRSSATSRSSGSASPRTPSTTSWRRRRPRRRRRREEVARPTATKARADAGLFLWSGASASRRFAVGYFLNASCRPRPRLVWSSGICSSGSRARVALPARRAVLAGSRRRGRLAPMPGC